MPLLQGMKLNTCLVSGSRLLGPGGMERLEVAGGGEDSIHRWPDSMFCVPPLELHTLLGVGMEPAPD